MRVIQTRVNEELDAALKAEAARRRLPVSQLIRNVLEDTVELVGNVVDNVDTIAHETVGLGRQVGADARRLARGTRRRRRRGSRREALAAPGEAPEDVKDSNAAKADPIIFVYAWQAVVANAAQTCARCGEAIGAGDAAYIGLTDEPGPRLWLCEDDRDRL